MRFRRLFTSYLQHETNGAFTELVGVLPGGEYDSILSRARVSSKLGAVQSLRPVVGPG